MARGWRTLFDRARSRVDDAPDADPFARAERLRPEPDALTALLDAVEATALEVYAEHGLPTRPGHYRRGPRAGRWTWFADRLEPEVRWRLVLEKPPEKGWRFGALEDIGAHETSRPPLIEASRLLRAAAALKARLREGGAAPAEDLADALTLGAEWRAVKDARAWRAASRLTLTAPGRKVVKAAAKPARKRR